MEKRPFAATQPPPPPAQRPGAAKWLTAAGAIALLGAAGLYHYRPDCNPWKCAGPGRGDGPVPVEDSPFGRFPLPGDTFRLIPCTDASLPPALDDPHPDETWAGLFDPDPAHWSWGNKTTSSAEPADAYAGRGIYLCGYLDVPIDYTNLSDSRIVRLAITKFQVSGLARIASSPAPAHKNPPAGGKSPRTIVVEPGGPGSSGTAYVWREAEAVTARLSAGALDVLGWDPRGVNASRPGMSCFPRAADREYWALLAGRYREEEADPGRLLRLADAMYEATFKACWEARGDLARFVSTAFVARDLEEIRKALGEGELTGYLVSYGTGIGQTYANMFPESVGRMVLDGTEYVRDHRLLGGFGWTALDNATDAWRQGVLGECINAGPAHCALARPVDGTPVTLDALETRMSSLITSLIDRPVAASTPAIGPWVVTYSGLVGAVYQALYNAQTWPALARMLAELEAGNATLAAAFLEVSAWREPAAPCTSPARPPATHELLAAVVCADAYDAPQPADGLAWWAALWADMTARSWVSGNARFYNVFPCRHFTTYWPRPAEVYRGGLGKKLKNPVLLIAETHDPATPLRNGRRLLAEMGRNARLIVHHGYGHSSRDRSRCTDGIGRRYILTGELPEEAETDCFADEKPYLYGVKDSAETGGEGWDPVAAWREHLGG